jgi:hypothetical protein
VEHLRAQASDGDNWDDDSELCRDWLEQHILPVVQYYLCRDQRRRTAEPVGRIREAGPRPCPPLRATAHRTPGDIYPVFRELFRSACHEPRRKPAAPLLAQGSDWTFEELDRYDAEIGRVARLRWTPTPTSSRSSPPSR